jgi:hypothetical protein
VQGIYNYVPGTMFLGYIAAAILELHIMAHEMLFPMLNILYFCISTFQTVCAVHSVGVACSCLMACFTHMLLPYFLKD